VSTRLTDSEFFKGKRIVVTGVSRGIGRAAAEFFLSNGAEVIGVSKNPVPMRKTKKELAKFGKAVSLITADVGKPATSRRVAAEVKRRWGGLDVLFNCAAVLYRDGCLDQEKEDWLEKTLRVNVLGIHYMIRACLPYLLKGVQPRILNFSSAAAIISGAFERGDHDIASYRVSKLAVNAVTLVYAPRLKGKVSVLSFDPGWIKTEMGGPDAKDEMPEAIRRISDSLKLDWQVTGKFVCGENIYQW